MSDDNAWAFGWALFALVQVVWALPVALAALERWFERRRGSTAPKLLASTLPSDFDDIEFADRRREG